MWCAWRGMWARCGMVCRDVVPWSDFDVKCGSMWMLPFQTWCDWLEMQNVWYGIWRGRCRMWCPGMWPALLHNARCGKLRCDVVVVWNCGDEECGMCNVVLCDVRCGKWCSVLWNMLRCWMWVWCGIVVYVGWCEMWTVAVWRGTCALRCGGVKWWWEADCGVMWCQM